MISIILDEGARLRRLSRSQMNYVKEQFILYLVHGISFREAIARCNAILEDDQHAERVVIKERLAAMIEDHYCNTVVKPAIIMLARGDRSAFRKAHASTAFTATVIRRHPKIFRRVVRDVKFDDLSPRGIATVERDYLERVQSHARNYVWRKAKFLMSAEHGLSASDMINDLQLLALRAFRWYFPFRSGLHMLNTMRSTISNRGKSMVKYNVADSRRRLIALPNGETYNRESSGDYDKALNSSVGSSNPVVHLDLQLSLEKLGRRPDYSRVVKFVASPKIQDRFVGWASHRVGVRFSDMEDLSAYIAREKLSYTRMLSRFLAVPPTKTREVLKELRAIV